MTLEDGLTFSEDILSDSHVKKVEHKIEIAARMLCLSVSFDLFYRCVWTLGGGP